MQKIEIKILKVESLIFIHLVIVLFRKNIKGEIKVMENVKVSKLKLSYYSS